MQHITALALWIACWYL